MSFAKINIPGWAVLEKLTSAQMNAMDAYWPNVIDGGAGGTWAPTNPIVIGGDGLTMTGLLTCEGDVTIGNVGPTNQLTVNCDAFFNYEVAFGASGKATFNGDTEFNGQNQFDDIVSFSGTSFVTVSGDFVCDAASTVEFQNGATVSAGDFIVDGVAGLSTASGTPATFGGVVTFSGAGIVISSATPVVFESVITPSGAGRIKKRPQFSMPNSNQTIGVASGGAGSGADSIKVDAGVFSADRVVFLTSTNAGDGDRMVVKTDETGFKLTLQQDDFSFIADLKADATFSRMPAAGYHKWVELEHSGSANGWRVLRGFYAP